MFIFTYKFACRFIVLMEKKAIFAGSFDPFTAGHENIVRRALALFDEVVVGVGYNIKKKGLLTMENRVRLIRDVFRDEPRVRVETYDGLTADFCHRQGIRILLRGLRSVDDFESDRTIDAINKRLDPRIETFYLLTDPYLGAISSAVVKELYVHKADLERFLPKGIDLEKYL
ncbi:pantetheine-phosphate adenylyltransferase [uncultured Rikenella sp.]|uniref:pantetheine-phosphate adenylyltransferase n=1 Tax=uncultured Rikenella sp. TaxID=368003 RepID=UPI002729C6C4|nr:pantetheine-phosphate adenylyltransferase [uncultured Rikenella sp.]